MGMRHVRSGAMLLLLWITCCSSGVMPPSGGVDSTPGFHVKVAPGGAAVLTTSASASAEHLTTVSSSFSEPGPLWHNLSVAPDAGGWTVTVDSANAASGRWVVRANAASFRLVRVYALIPPQAGSEVGQWRLLVNDTITTLSSSSLDATVGISVQHRATVARTAEEVEEVLVPGTFSRTQCGTDGNPGDTCASPCADPNVRMQNNGRPDIFANRSGFGIGMVAVDDVFRVHAQTKQFAKTKAAPWETGSGSCDVTDPPTIVLSDPFFAVAGGGASYTMEWAVYPLTRDNCTDYFCFLNAERHDMHADTLTMERTGFLNLPDSVWQDTSVWSTSGYSECNLTGVSTATRLSNSSVLSSCWENWDAQKFEWFLRQQAGPGGFVDVGNGDFVGDGVCGQVDVDGTRFTNASDRPAAYTHYIQNVVNALKRANAVRPARSKPYASALYFHSYLSTGTQDTGRFQDSVVRGVDGSQQWYDNCTQAGGPVKLMMPLFYADGTNTYTAVLDQYVDEAFALGADGLFHDEFPLSAVAYTYGAWDHHSAFLDPVNLTITHKVGSLVLLTHAHEMAIRRKVYRSGRFIVYNGSPMTRAWTTEAEAAGLPATLNENENSIAWRTMHVQLYTPIMLTRYGGNIGDEDPRYNATNFCGKPECTDTQAYYRFMTNPCFSLTNHLDFGVLSASYGGLFANSSVPTIYAQLMPTTALQLGEGFVLGKERAVTKVPGRYVAPAASAKTRSKTYLYRDCFLVGATSGGAEVELELEPGLIAIIVWL